MAINSKVIICRGISIDRQYTNVLDYNETQMLNLCNSKKVAERNNYSFVAGRENTISTDFNYDDVIKCNYIAFQNQRYSNKWFFAWIDKVDYVNDGVTRISFTVDHWSTWFGYWSKRPCFTIREHVADDTIGLHTLDEGLPVNRVETLETHIEAIYGTPSSDFWVGIYSDYDIEDNTSYTGVFNIIDSNICGHPLLLFRIQPDDPEDPSSFLLENSINNIRYYIIKAGVEGKVSDIKDMFIIPYSLVNQTLLQYHDPDIQFGSITRKVEFYTFKDESLGAQFTDISIAKKTSWSDYTPANNKCYCYPYNFLFLTNNVGNQNILKYEDFSGTNATFRIEKALSIGGSIRCIPTNHKGKSKDYDEQIACAKFPMCNWSTDSYNNWLSQNSLNLVSRIMGVAGETIHAVTTVGSNMIAEAEGMMVGQMGVGEIGGAASSILDLMGTFKKADLMPNIEGGSLNNGDVGFASGSYNFNFYMQRATLENIKIIDNYFTKYGYKVNRLKIPEFGSRLYWNYVQIAREDTIGIPSIVDNGVTKTTPDNSFEVINNIARKGVTIWHDHDYIGNYGLPNTILN